MRDLDAACGGNDLPTVDDPTTAGFWGGAVAGALAGGTAGFFVGGPVGAAGGAALGWFGGGIAGSLAVGALADEYVDPMAKHYGPPASPASPDELSMFPDAFIE